jgi:hypothetical protein
LQIREADQLYFLLKRRRRRHARLIAAGLLVAGALSGCMSTEVADNAPRPSGMNDTGSYPLLGEPLQAATTQMSDAEAAAQGSKLQALAAAHKAGTVSEAEYNRKVAEMRKLGQATQDAAKPDTPATN